MSLSSFRHLPLVIGISSLALLVLASLPGCSSDLLVPMTRPTGPAPTASEVQAALNLWPQQPQQRTFFATIHAAGHRVTATGVLDYHSPTDFRITTISELGQVLFDARYNWAGVHVLRIMPNLSPSVVETLCHDLSLALRVPPATALKNLQIRDHDSILVVTTADSYKFTYDFANPDARLRSLDINMGAFDTLYITYPQYTPTGEPQQISLARPLRAYSITLSFTSQP